MTWDTLTLVLAQDAQDDRPIAPGSPAETTGAGSQLDASQQTPVAPNGPPAARSPEMQWIWLLLPAILILFMLTSGRKEKKKRAKLMAALSKGDKVQTTGGVLGTVVEVRDDEVVVKVDENTNTRLRFTRGAIQAILESKNAD